MSKTDPHTVRVKASLTDRKSVYDVGLMLDQRQKRWTNIKPTLNQRKLGTYARIALILQELMMSPSGT